MAFNNTRRLIALLYLTAGLPFGLFFEAMPPYLRVLDCSLRDIGLLLLVQLPWSAKPLWAPMVDRLLTPRTWLLAAQTGLLLSFLMLAAVAKVPSTWALSTALLLMTFTSSTQDIVVDGLFVRIVQRAGPAQEAQGNGTRVVAYKVAVLLGGGGTVILGSQVGWSEAFVVVAAVFCVGAFFIDRALGQESLPTPVSFAVWRQSLAAWLQRPGSSGTFAFVLLYKLALGTLGPMAKPFWVDRGLKVSALGLKGSTLGLVGTILGAWLGSTLTARWGLIKTLIFGALSQCVLCCVYASIVALSHGTRFWPDLGITLEGLGQGLASSALMVLLTRICDREHAATQFAALSALFGITRATGGLLGGLTADAYGFSLCFAAAGCIALVPVLLTGQVVRRLKASAGAQQVQPQAQAP